jgi:hypothetical protein
LLGSAFALALLVVLVLVSVRTHDATGFLFDEVVAFVAFVFGIALAVRRKVTLTTHHLIIRRLFRTRVLPLHEIVDVRRRSIGSFDHSLTNDLITMFLPKPVMIELPNYRTCATNACGWSSLEAVRVIAKAAKAAGSPIDI